MKRLLILAMSLMLALPASVYANEPAFSWRKALENAKQNTKRGITLKSYKVQGKIRTEAQLKKLIDSWYCEDAYMVTMPSDESRNAVVLKAGEYMRINNLPSADFDRTKTIIKPQIENIFTNDKNAITLVELCWEVDGRTFTTMAAVSDKYEFIFDKIGTYAIVDDDIKAKHSDEKSDSQTSRNIYLSGYAKNVFGLDAYNYDLYVSASFNQDGILIDRSSRSSVSQSAGWLCEAKASVSGGEIDKSKYTDYEIGYHLLGATSRSHSESGSMSKVFELE